MENTLLRLLQTEVQHQCELSFYALEQLKTSVEKIQIPSDSVGAWFYVQGFLTSTANISKLLFGSGREIDPKRKPLRESLGVSEDSILWDRFARNAYEHFDQKIEKWHKSSTDHSFADRLIGPTQMIQGISNTDSFRHLDTSQWSIRFNGKDYLIEPITRELRELHKVASLEVQKPDW